MESLFNQKQVIMIGESKYEYLKNRLCSNAVKQSLDIDGHKLLRSRVDDSLHPLGGIVLNDAFVRKHPNEARILQKAIQLATLEGQLQIGLMQLLEGSSASIVNSERGQTKEKIMRCNNHFVERQEIPVLFNPDVHSLKLLSMICISSFLLSVATLLLEIV